VRERITGWPLFTTYDDELFFQEPSVAQLRQLHSPVICCWCPPDDDLIVQEVQRYFFPNAQRLSFSADHLLAIPTFGDIGIR
jgi:hypothetical protein